MQDKTESIRIKKLFDAAQPNKKFIDSKALIQALNDSVREQHGLKNKKEFYLVEELAERLRVSNMTIYRYIKAGKLSAHKIGKEFRITAEEFNTFLGKVKTK